jgi:hypothetical protein
LSSGLTGEGEAVDGGQDLTRRAAGLFDFVGRGLNEHLVETLAVNPFEQCPGWVGRGAGSALSTRGTGTRSPTSRMSATSPAHAAASAVYSRTTAGGSSPARRSL